MSLGAITDLSGRQFASTRRLMKLDVLSNACLYMNFGTESSYLQEITTTVSEWYVMAQPTCPTQLNCNRAFEVSKWETKKKKKTEYGTYVSSAFAKLWEATISFIMSVCLSVSLCPSVHPHGTARLPLSNTYYTILSKQLIKFNNKKVEHADWNPLIRTLKNKRKKPLRPQPLIPYTYLIGTTCARDNASQIIPPRPDNTSSDPSWIIIILKLWTFLQKSVI